MLGWGKPGSSNKALLTCQLSPDRGVQTQMAWGPSRYESSEAGQVGRPPADLSVQNLPLGGGNVGQIFRVKKKKKKKHAPLPPIFFLPWVVWLLGFCFYK